MSLGIAERIAALLLPSTLLVAPAPAGAAAAPAAENNPNAPAVEASPDRPFSYATLAAPSGTDSEFLPDCDWLCYAHLYGTLSVGRGLRFNNPYRLRTVLGSSPRSLSATAPYTELAFAALFGDPVGFQQGVVVGSSFALLGIPQQVVAPGYAALYRFGPRTQLRSSLALPIVLQPDANVGVELALGGAVMVLSGIGVVTAVVGSLYEGAGTDQRAATLIPVLSFQLGMTVDYEVLP